MEEIVDRKKYDKFEKYRMEELEKVTGYISFDGTECNLCQEHLFQPLQETANLMDNYIEYPFENRGFIDEDELSYMQKRLANEVDAYKKHAAGLKKMDEIEIFERIRSIYPDFGNNFNSKMSPEDSELYKIQFKKLRKIFNSIKYNDDYIKRRSMRRFDYQICKTIDSSEFDKACKIENEFFIKEFQTLIEKIYEMYPECGEQTSNSVFKSVYEIEEFAQSEIYARTTWIEKYDERVELNRKLQNKKRFVLTKHYEEPSI